MNNVVATAYQWNPVTGGMEMAAALMSNRPDKKLKATEAFSRATVGGAALAYAMDFQEEQQKKGYAYNELDTGTGEVTDITNGFPLSLLMIAGRVGMKMRNGETVDRDLANEFGKQIAIGQAATDLQFGNDISRILTLAFNQDDEFNYRLIQNGKKIWMDSSIETKYYSRSNFIKLFKQYFRYGFFDVIK